MSHKISPYKRLLLKISGQTLAGSQGIGISPETLSLYAKEVADAASINAEIAIVVGGGNLFRGATLAQSGVERITADHIGMLSTLINCLALRDALEHKKLSVTVMCAFGIPGVCDTFDHRRASELLKQGKIVLFGGGTGNPLMTTDTCASLRAIETQCDVLIKATHVQGIYDTDPHVYPDARLLSSLTFDEVIAKQYKVMDLAAFCQCQEHNIPIIVCNIEQPGTLKRIVQGKLVGTYVNHS